MVISRRIGLYAITAACCMFSAQIYAVSDKINIDGFFTLAATQLDNDKNTAYHHGLAEHKLKLFSPDNRFGLQLAANINTRFNLTAQLLSRRDADQFNMITDWAYVKYKAGNNFHVHAGKFKIPQYLISDYEEVGFAYPWVRPPQDVYSTNPLTSLTGVDLFFKYKLATVELLFQMYYGNDSHDVPIPSRSIDGPAGPAFLALGITKGTTIPFETFDMSGINLAARSDAFTFALSYFQTKVDIDVLRLEGVKGDFSSAGFIFDRFNFLMYSEYILRDVESDAVLAFPDQAAWYVTLGYRAGSLLPHVTYSKIDEGKDKNMIAIKQSSIALGLRYDISNSAALKLEALRAEPVEGNHGLFDDPVEKSNVYTVVLDVIF